jgi:protein-disulfide isomerase
MELTNPVNDKDHASGNNGAFVTLVEYGDFQCPNCKDAYPVIKEVQKREGDKLRFVFRNFPLSSIHAYATHASYAAEAAGKQGKFWEMHDMLFENQNALEDDDLISYAKVLNLDIEQFKKDIASEEIAKKVREDFVGGAKSGVNGTPTLFINGIRFDGPCEVENIIEAIEGGEYK